MALIKFITKSALDSPYENKYSDDQALENVISYAYDLKNDGWKTNGYVGGWAVDPRTAITEMKLLTKFWHKESGIRLRHWIISFTEGDLEQAARRLPGQDCWNILYRLGLEFTAYYAEQYQIVFAVHLDHGAGHLHIVANTVSYVDGRKYSGTKQEYYEYLRYVNLVARRFGFNIYPVADRRAGKGDYAI